jgi:hypothetical protein
VAALIDELLPEADVAMRHVRTVDAPPERVWAAIRTADLGGAGIIRLLFAIRSIPALLTRRVYRPSRAKDGSVKPPLTLDRIIERGFGLVDERPGEEMVLGVVGRFWKASGQLRAADRERFRLGPPAGEALAAWNFRVTPHAEGATLLSTETRIRCADAQVRRTFRRYWLVVHPGSALIRRAMLAAVAREASGRA